MNYPELEICCPAADCPDGDYWMGALKYCKDLGLEPLTRTDALSIEQVIKDENFNGEFTKTLTGLTSTATATENRHVYALLYEQNAVPEFIGKGAGTWAIQPEVKFSNIQGYTYKRYDKTYHAICKAK